MNFTKMRIIFILILTISNFLFFGLNTSKAEKILIPMDLAQNDHLKAYGLIFWHLQHFQKVDWLLNYRNGSFMTDYNSDFISESRIRGVSFEVISNSDAESIVSTILADDVNMDIAYLEKAPRIGVYVTPGIQPWDDAVRMALEYAEIKYETLWDEEVLTEKLKEIDWLHVHHEDFTGQLGKFWANYQSYPWYIQQVSINENMTKKLGYSKVSEMKKDVVLKMREFIANGGYMFGMCSATDTWDIALAAQNTDICPNVFDGDPADPNANKKLDFSQTLVFENFEVSLDPFEYEHSSIDIKISPEKINPDGDFFTLFDFSAKFDPIPTMLTQSHENIIRGFLGQTTGFHRQFIKKNVVILGEKENSDEVRYLLTNFGKGFLAWYGGHDPEDYQHFVGDPATDLNLYKNSAGYRLILNNVLFPAAKKKTLKT
jgi:hypothetical protein